MIGSQIGGCVWIDLKSSACHQSIHKKAFFHLKSDHRPSRIEYSSPRLICHSPLHFVDPRLTVLRRLHVFVTKLIAEVQLDEPCFGH